MTPPDLKKAVQDILPQLIAEDSQVRDFVLRTVSNYYASRAETESRFDRVLAELQRDREEQSRQWDEQYQQNRETLANLERDREEQSRKWDEQSRKWDEQYQQNRETLANLERDREEQSRKWDEQSRQWNEQHQQTQTMLAEIQDQKRRYDSSIGAIGSRWGFTPRRAFAVRSRASWNNPLGCRCSTSTILMKRARCLVALTRSSSTL